MSALPVYLRCTACGWCHCAAEPGEPAATECFRCRGRDFSEIDAAEVPRGVTLQALVAN